MFGLAFAYAYQAARTPEDAGKFRALARGSWVKKAKGKHRGVVTRTAEAVFEALIAGLVSPAPWGL